MDRSYSRTRPFMDDSSFRSAPMSSFRYDEMIVDRRTPRYSPALYDDRQRTSYFDRSFEDEYDRRSRSPYNSGFYGYDSDCRFGSDEIVRRTNRQVAIANNAITRAHVDVQIHPMMTPDGRYPSYFSMPRRLGEFVRMSPRELDSIMMEYELGSSRRRYYRGSIADRFDDGDPFTRSSTSPRDLSALLYYLGAYRIVDHLTGRRYS